METSEEKLKRLRKRDKTIEKNIDSVIKHFELEGNVKNFLEKAILKQKKYSPSLNKKAKEIVEKEIGKVLKGSIISSLIKEVVTQIVREIAYEEFHNHKENLKSEYIDNIHNMEF